LIAYGQDLNGFEDVLRDRKVHCNDQMKFITEAEHVHSSSEEYQKAVRGIEDAAGHGFDV